MIDPNSAQAITDSDPPPQPVATDDSATSITYAGSWKTKSNSSSLAGRYHRSSKPNAAVSFSFTGSEFTWNAARGPKCGQATVRVDGATVATVDLYNPTKQWKSPVPISGLSDSLHTIQIVVLGTHRSAARGNLVVFDGFSARRNAATPKKQAASANVGAATTPRRVLVGDPRRHRGVVTAPLSPGTRRFLLTQAQPLLIFGILGK